MRALLQWQCAQVAIPARLHASAPATRQRHSVPLLKTARRAPALCRLYNQAISVVLHLSLSEAAVIAAHTAATAAGIPVVDNLYEHSRLVVPSAHAMVDSQVLLALMQGRPVVADSWCVLEAAVD